MKKFSGFLFLISALAIPDEGRFENAKEWKVIRLLNGDQIHQGRHIRIFSDDYSILRFQLYNYE